MLRKSDRICKFIGVREGCKWDCLKWEGWGRVMCGGAHRSATVPFLHHCAPGWNRGKWMKLQFRQQWWPNQLLFRWLYYWPSILNTCLCLCAFFQCEMFPLCLHLLVHDALTLSSQPYAKQLSGNQEMYNLTLKVRSTRDFTVSFRAEQMVITDSSLGKYREQIKLLSWGISWMPLALENQIIYLCVLT